MEIVIGSIIYRENHNIYILMAINIFLMVCTNEYCVREQVEYYEHWHVYT